MIQILFCFILYLTNTDTINLQHRPANQNHQLRNTTKLFKNVAGLIMRNKRMCPYRREREREKGKEGEAEREICKNIENTKTSSNTTAKEVCCINITDVTPSALRVN